MVLLVAPYVYATKIETHSHVRTHTHTHPSGEGDMETQRERKEGNDLCSRTRISSLNL